MAGRMRQPARGGSAPFMNRRRARDGLRRACLLALISLSLSCDRGDRGTAPEVEYSRCQAFYQPGRVCVLWPDRQLSLWVKSDPGAKVEIRAGDQRLTVDGEEVKGGRRY